ncbi:MAG: sugar transferase [Prevotellaceae bacterium]|jgi:lipopolysaccharide/colanic/teichoic acid biosynthesis glycosyltransferase|nr:sugar transferase [Prevotellaceae bacterium]
MYKRIKRFFDILLSLIGLIILVPVFFITAIVIGIESKGGVFFVQKRLGRKGLPFNMYKFRSMVKNAERQGTGVYSYKGDMRLTKVGRLIRAASIDELPQLINIVKGDMSIIGPRPALTYHPWPFEEYTEEQKRMFDVRPGITGWAQVNGRKQVRWPERIQLNIEYVDNMSFMFDMKILFMTFSNVFLMRGNNNIGETR